jgi:putative membrane protein
MMFWWGSGFPTGALGILMIILMIVFWGGLIALIVWAVSRVTREHRTEASGKQNALDIAKERYAKGEITKEQFEQIKKDLQS